MRIGAHVRRGTGGVAGAVEEALRRGADCAQVFLSNPRSWAAPRFSEHEAASFRETWAASGLGPLVAHAPYLVNLASASPDFLAKGRDLAAASLRACDLLGLEALVLHAGTGGSDEPSEISARAAQSLEILARHEGPARLIVELEEGISAAAASSITDAAGLLEAAGVDETVGLCLDTCHLFATGYALDTPEGVELLFAELRQTGLLGRVALVHANDAMFERGSHRDRHENIGDGHIGVEGFRALLTRPEVRDWVFILETPGDAARQGLDIATLRALASTSG